MELLNKNTVNQLPKGTVIFQESERAECVAIVLRGRVEIKNRGSNVIVGVGTFIGIPGAIEGKYESTYTAYDNVILYVFEMNEYSDLSRIASENKDYGGLMVASHSRYIHELNRICGLLRDEAKAIYEFITCYDKKFRVLAAKSGYMGNQSELISNDSQPYVSETSIDKELLEYYIQSCTVPINIQKEYFSNHIISTYHVKQQVPMVKVLIKECTELACYIYEEFMILLSDDKNCLFRSVVKLISDIGDNKELKKELTDIIDHTIEKVNAVEKLLHDEISMNLHVDHEYLEKIYYQILSGDLGDSVDVKEEKTSVVDESVIMRDTDDALNKILRYAGEEQEKCDKMKELIQFFINMHDKSATDDEDRRIRREIAQEYYDLYYKVLMKAIESNDENRLINLFLNYGFIDERLLTREQIITLYRLDVENEEENPCHVYTMREWLTSIYREEKEPSKSEFDMDYADALRERKRVEKLSDSQITQLSKDHDAKLKYEINNMFKYNNRISSGRITSFVPFLYKEVFYGTIEKAFHTARELNACVNRLLGVDFSIFSREVIYYDNEKGIKKEYVVKKVFPDIILLPVCGNNGVMWQEITGRHRDSKGRFLIPIFTEENLDGMMAQMFGRFRWEMCRTEQGTAWNSIQYPSLTSEYYDYIQFYQKNRDLSSEKKEKVKSQIVRGRSNMREIFLIDYIAWVTREYRGEIRLNKVARGILGTYIPFPQEIRERINTQPIFQEAMAKYERERLHRIKEMEGRFRALDKEGIEIPDVLTQTLEYVKQA